MHRGKIVRFILVLIAGLAIAGMGLFAGAFVRTVGGGKIAGRSIPGLRPAFDGKEQFTVLVVGLDVPDKLNPQLGQRADSLILMKMDLEKKEVNGISIPRDSLVEIPGQEHKDKINATYTVGGIDKTIETVEKLTSIRPDYYVVSDPRGFEKIVDLIGGIELDVEKDMDYDDNWQDLHIHLKKGFQHLNGEQAMGYVRFRHDRFADITRMERQQKFFRAVAQRMTALSNLPKLPQVMEEMKKAVQTNIEAPDLVYLTTSLRNAGSENIHMATFPGAPDMIRGVSYMVLDESAGRNLIADMFQVDLPGTATVEVLNGSATGGVARKVARKLESLGYRVVHVGNADRSDYVMTRIEHDPERLESANQIASLLATPDVQAKEAPAEPAGENAPEEPGEGERSDLTVIVGSDFTEALLQ